MVWLLVAAGVIILLQIGYIGLCRRDMEMGFLSQDAMLTRFGVEVAELRKRANSQTSKSESMEYRLSKMETELSQIKVLFGKLLAEREEAKAQTYFSDVS
ncbi:MAG: hypothetical protein CMK09_17905 [Ponticaulis sp.]|nr:hypothetical protein [Ponticaulis sp.]|tara:strand:- start:5343 stop:5642 length:300 start_codon:yes stop_codon:yes gene_type:complete